jgi:hypothetical protein
VDDDPLNAGEDDQRTRQVVDGDVDGVLRLGQDQREAEGERVLVGGKGGGAGQQGIGPVADQVGLRDRGPDPGNGKARELTGVRGLEVEGDLGQSRPTHRADSILGTGRE